MSDTPERILLERNVAIPLRDGTVTRANIWRPADAGPVPAILVRTPYTKEAEEITAFCEPRIAAARGFAVVAQDVRGRWASAGEFDPYLQEGADGYDTIEQVAAMDWCSGDVVMAGNSYVGATQWLAAIEQPPALKAIAPGLTADRYDEGWTYRGGALELAFIHSWIAAALAPPDQLWLDDAERSYAARDELIALAPWSAPWFREAPGSEYWNAISISARRERVRVPSLNVGGWYDIFLDGTLRNFAADEHPLSRLVVGPWGHDDFMPNLVGERNLGHAGSGDGYGFFERALEFYESAIAGRQSALPRVSAYMLGARRWLELDDWPPPGASPVALPLPVAAFDHDASDLPPSLGGRALRINTAGGAGFGQFDQRPAAAHPNTRLLELGPSPSARLAGAVAGRLRTRMTGGERGDWACTLCFREPGGALINLCEGIARADANAEAVDVALGHICVELPGAPELALLVSGASYPRWEPLGGRHRQRVEDGSVLELHAL